MYSQRHCACYQIVVCCHRDHLAPHVVVSNIDTICVLLVISTTTGQFSFASSVQARSVSHDTFASIAISAGIIFVITCAAAKITFVSHLRCHCMRVSSPLPLYSVFSLLPGFGLASFSNMVCWPGCLPLFGLPDQLYPFSPGSARGESTNMAVLPLVSLLLDFYRLMNPLTLTRASQFRGAPQARPHMAILLMSVILLN